MRLLDARCHYLMTAKERLKERIEDLSEDQAADTLRFVEGRLRSDDPLDALLDAATLDDEPLTREEEESIRQGPDDHAAGRTISLEDARRELLGRASPHRKSSLLDELNVTCADWTRSRYIAHLMGSTAAP